MSAIEKMVEWLEVMVQINYSDQRKPVYESALDKARSLLAEESQESTDGALVEAFKNAIRKKIDSPFYPRTFSVDEVNTILSRHAQAKPTADKGLVEELEKLAKVEPQIIKEGREDETALICQGRLQIKDRLTEILSHYRPTKSGVTENTSDGFHTFKELYDHRIALYLNIVNQNSEWFWKSKKHEDGSELKGWFILGGNMGTGDISYHLPMDKWEMAHCKELPKGEKWDGHTAADVVERVLRHSQASNIHYPTESLAELADRKGCDIMIHEPIKHTDNKYTASVEDKDHDFMVFKGVTRAEAESKARSYLESLPEVIK